MLGLSFWGGGGGFVKCEGVLGTGSWKDFCFWADGGSGTRAADIGEAGTAMGRFRFCGDLGGEGGPFMVSFEDLFWICRSVGPFRGSIGDLLASS